MRMVKSRFARRAIVIGAAAIVGWVSAISFAEAGGILTSRSLSTGPILTNPGARYSLDYGSQFHTHWRQIRPSRSGQQVPHEPRRQICLSQLLGRPALSGRGEKVIARRLGRG